MTTPPHQGTHTLFICDDGTKYLLGASSLDFALLDSSYEPGHEVVDREPQVIQYVGGVYQDFLNKVRSDEIVGAIPVTDDVANLDEYDFISLVDGEMHLSLINTRKIGRSITDLSDPELHHHHQVLGGLREQLEDDQLIDRLVSLQTAWELGTLDMSREDILALDAARKSLFEARQGAKAIIEPIRSRRKLPDRNKSRSTDLER